MIPILIVVVLFLATTRVIHAVQDAPKPANVVEVTAIGHQFWWEFRYPALGIVTANELHIPVSDPANPIPTYLKLLSADTDHSFWVPQLAGKTDLIPNRVNEMWMDPAPRRVFSWGSARNIAARSTRKCCLRVIGGQPGRFCRHGPTRRSNRRRQDEAVSAGRHVFETTACINCHAVAGTAATGRFGPDLTHMMSRQHDRRRRGRKYPGKPCACGFRIRKRSNRVR